jgi:hypothetical protein
MRPHSPLRVATQCHALPRSATHPSCSGVTNAARNLANPREVLQQAGVAADYVIGYAGVVERPGVLQHADHVVYSFDELTRALATQ